MEEFLRGKSHACSREDSCFREHVLPRLEVQYTTLEISAPRCALMCYPSSNITYCIACLLCIGVILLNKFNSIKFNKKLYNTTQIVPTLKFSPQNHHNNRNKSRRPCCHSERIKGMMIIERRTDKGTRVLTCRLSS